MTKQELLSRAYQRMLARSVRTPNGCLEYQGAHTGDGYACVRVGTRIMSGHRLAWLATQGRIPAGKHVLHDCDNPPCIETGPGHLHLGTHAQNMAEMATRRRAASGERHGHAKLTNAQVDEIRVRFFTEKITHRALAADYGVDESQISRVIARRTFATA